MKKFTAIEACLEAQKNEDALVQREYNLVMDRIVSAVERGDFSCYVGDPSLHVRTIDKLRGDGFVVEDTSAVRHGPLCYFKVSWNCK